MVKVAHVQLSSCCGCLVSLADTYEQLLDVLGAIDLVYSQTLADVREVPDDVDIILLEGSVCLSDHHAMEVALDSRKKAKILVALGACAATGNVTRFSKGNQPSKPVHDAFAPLTEVVKCDLAIPGCPPSPESIVAVVLAALNGDMEYLEPYAELAKYGSEACGCDLITKVINKSLCMGCGSCAAACPTRAVSMDAGRPLVDKEICIKCGSCSVQCPRIRFPDLIEKIE